MCNTGTKAPFSIAATFEGIFVYKHQRMVFVRSVMVFGAAAASAAGVACWGDSYDDVIFSHGKIQQCWYEVEDQRGFHGKFCITRYESVVPLDAFNHNREPVVEPKCEFSSICGVWLDFLVFSRIFKVGSGSWSTLVYVLLLLQLLLLEGYLHTHRRTMMSGANESEQQMQQTHGSYTKALTRKHRHKSIRIDDDLLVWACSICSCCCCFFCYQNKYIYACMCVF